MTEYFTSLHMMNLSPENKIAGVLAPLFALRSQQGLGIGDVETLSEFIEWAREVGFRVVQLLPINEVGRDNSPYNAISAMAIEPTTLHLVSGSPAELTQEAFQTVLANENLEALRHGPVKYDRVRKLKRALLESAFDNFQVNPIATRQAEFGRFCASEGRWLKPYAFFRALMEWNGETETWDKWQLEHRDPKTARSWLEKESAEVRAQFSRREKFFCYVQWIADEQWRELRKFAEERGVALMGDIPFGVSYYSADVFSEREIFHLDWSGGAPPEPYFKDDEFTMKWGQNWGIPVYNWAALRAQDFAWWRQRVVGVKRIFHIFRIDHVLGFYRIYAFPWRPGKNKEFLPLDWNGMLAKTGGQWPHFMPRDDESPQNAEANRREGEEYLRMVLTESAATRIVGEDLGTVPKYVRPSLHSLGIAGFKIPQWEFRDGTMTPGSEFERLSVTTYATHDHKPIRQLWAEAVDGNSPTSAQAREDVLKIAQFSGIVPREGLEYERDVYPAMMNALFNSNSWLAIVMITDLLARKDRFNVPGTAVATNWARRLSKTVSEMRTSRTVRRRMTMIRELLEKSGRVPSRQPERSEAESKNPVVQA
jgi:4-alpha-glucanotransferase